MIDFKNMAGEEKALILAFYKKNIQRHLYGKNRNTLFISKNAAFCTWLPELKSLFPQAQFIVTIRDPETAIPTQLNALKSARAVFGTDPNGIATRAIIQQSFEKNYTSVFHFLKSTSKMNCALIQQEELRKDSIGILTQAINQLAITLPIESIQVKSSKENKTVYKKNTSVAEDPINPSITKIYKCIIELDLSINS